MSDNSYSRRSVAIGGGIAAALGIAALGITVPRLFGRHYRKTPYDDLFAQLIDRDAATKVGEAALETFKPGSGLPRELRQRFERRTLGEVANADLAEGKLMEVKGWVLPESVALLCVLAAQNS